MGLFGKIKNTLGKAPALFNKISDAGAALFNKGEVGGRKLFGEKSEGSKLLGDISKGLNVGANLASNAGKQLGGYVNQAQPYLGAIPYGSSIATLGQGISKGLEGVGSTLGMASDATKQKNYGQVNNIEDFKNIANNALEKAKAVKDSASNINFV